MLPLSSTAHRPPLSNRANVFDLEVVRRLGGKRYQSGPFGGGAPWLSRTKPTDRPSYTKRGASRARTPRERIKAWRPLAIRFDVRPFSAISGARSVGRVRRKDKENATLPPTFRGG